MRSKQVIMMVFKLSMTFHYMKMEGNELYGNKEG